MLPGEPHARHVRANENVAGATPAASRGTHSHEIHPSVRPLGRVVVGKGNDAGGGAEGALAGRVLGTYLHGPVLARNPALADHLLASVVGPLEPLDDGEADVLRNERLAAARHERR